MSKPEKLAAMANQMATFFRTQRGDPAADLANHLLKFWTPGMCATLSTYVEAGGELDPLAKQAVAKL